MATAIVPPIYDEHLADAISRCPQNAPTPCASVSAQRGLLVGVSAAAAVAASLQVAEEEARAGRDAVIVTMLCDSAEKYLSERFWRSGMQAAARTRAVSERSRQQRMRLANPA